MLAISVRQPWAELILQGKKTIEVRKSSTTHRGFLVIHAANLIRHSEFTKANIDLQSIAKFKRKALIGVVEIVDILKLNETLWEDLRTGHLLPGRWLSEDHKYAWFLESPKRIKPIAYNGLPKFFDIDEKTVHKIIKELK